MRALWATVAIGVAAGCSGGGVLQGPSSSSASSSSGSSGAVGECLPGASEQCPCPGIGNGLRFCREDAAWSGCLDCPAESSGAGGASTASGSGGNGGDGGQGGEVCVPADPAVACPVESCESVPDGCGGDIACETCSGPDVCYSGACCTPKTMQTVCNPPPGQPPCGFAPDGCGDSVLCGICSNPDAVCINNGCCVAAVSCAGHCGPISDAENCNAGALNCDLSCAGSMICLVNHRCSCPEIGTSQCPAGWYSRVCGPSPNADATALGAVYNGGNEWCFLNGTD